MAQAPALTIQDVLEVIKANQQSAFSKDDLKLLLQELKKPYVDEVARERDRREAIKTKRDMDNGLKLKALTQKACPHAYKKSGISSISIVHNFPDRQTRGRCNLCNIYIEPEHWEIDYDKLDPAGKPRRVAEHPLYHLVKQLEADTAYQLVG